MHSIATNEMVQSFTFMTYIAISRQYVFLKNLLFNEIAAPTSTHPHNHIGLVELTMPVVVVNAAHNAARVWMTKVTGWTIFLNFISFLHYNTILFFVRLFITLGQAYE